jgi:hypothetical protein
MKKKGKHMTDTVITAKPTLYEVIILAAQIADLDDSVRMVQEVLGVEDGGYASIHFDHVLDVKTGWGKISSTNRRGQLIDYARSELASAKSNLPPVEWVA